MSAVVLGMTGSLFAAEKGSIRLMNAVNNGPTVSKPGGDQVRGNFEDYRALKIPFARTHDSIGCCPGGAHTCDIQAVFPDFEKDVLVAKKVGSGMVVFSSVVPWTFDAKEQNLRLNRRRAQGLVTRLVANLGGAVADVFPGVDAQLYADKPIAIDDPYRYFRW